MKRIVSVSMIVCILLCLCACSENTQNIKEPISFYYRMRDIQYDTEGSILATEICERYGHTEDYEYLLQGYLAGPKSDECISPFPAGTSLESINLVMNKVHIVLSEHLSMLSGSDLIIACACLSKTVLEMTDAQSVQISSLNSQLNGQDYITMNRDSSVFWDSFPVQLGKH